MKKLRTTQKAFFPIAYYLLPSHTSKYGYATLREQKSKRIPISPQIIISTLAGDVDGT
ncbi:hypothetical protein [Nostoc sp. LEGE 12450]|uniref:hypothetical protein n=1 Tax=Nostoc sp. LEGE 12450 TaxID=1828643 RepID=UPI00188076CB|nr:hypothetical protein [Nostoc sp. LEGE 12450]MBE8990241.1 hypothetical protein [Nostoc sp. LEGE 12450]